MRTEYMMGHVGLVPLGQNYKTNMLEMAAEYVKMVPDLTIDDAERLKLSNRAMAESIRRMEGEKDAEIERLEAQVRDMEERMSRMGDGGARTDEMLEAILKSPKARGMPAGVMGALKGMMDGLVAAQEDEMREMRAEYDAKIEAMRREMGRMAKEENVGRDPPAWPGEDTPDEERRGRDQP